MKKFSLLFMTTLFVTFVNAQSIGVGTSSPAGSSLIDISSTSKGLLMPRMTTAQRAAITLPATGLLVFDMDTKTIWAYDGSSWKNLYSSGGGLMLPYAQTINTVAHAFQVTNQGSGAGLFGSSSNEFGMGILANATGAYGWGLNAFTNRPGGVTIRAVADTGMVFYGENINTGNTNTLMHLLNKGLGRTHSLQLANSANTSANLYIAGNHLGEQIEVFQTNAANSSAAVSINNSGTGAGLYSIANNGTGVRGTSSSGYGIKGETNTSLGFAGVHGSNTGNAGSGVVGVSDAVNTQGIYGTSANGIGVRASSGTYRGVQGTSTSGTGVYAGSTSGLALETVGNIKLSGGNTNPFDGAVLTSDVSGNAVWKRNKIAFRINGVHSNYSNASNNNYAKVHFNTQDFDYGNHFITINENGNTSEGSNFYVPVAGVYHFNSNVTLSSASDLTQLVLRYVLVRNGVRSNIAEKRVLLSSTVVGAVSSELNYKLMANDRVFVEVLYQGAASASFATNQWETWFEGNIVFEE
jgi:hypothetical protein